MVTAAFDVGRKFVWVNDIQPNGLVEFEFAIGDPDVSVELVMPQAAFDEFCAANQVEHIAKPLREQQPATAEAEFAWKLHHATHQRFR